MITITLAPCPGADKPFAAVTKETVAFVGVDVPDGLKAALFDGSGTCLAVADVQDAQATLDLDTQEAVDATAPVGPGEAVSVWLVVGDKDTHVATVPCKLIRNLIDDSAYHPPAPLPEYWTAEQVKAAIDAHARRTDNPHKVRAKQVGAVPLLGTGESADPDTHGKTALVTQNGTQGGFAVSGQAGADPDSEAYVTRYQRDAITAFGADEAEVERYLIGPQTRNQPKSILRIGDLYGTKPVTVTPESVGYRQKVTLALQIDRETLAHATTFDAIDWVPSSKAVQAALDQKANAAEVYKKAETYSKAEVDDKDASTLAEAKAYADGKVAGAYRYKGTVATKEALPSSGNTVGDVWNVSEDGMNYAWTGEEWDALGTSVDLSAYYTKTESDGKYLPKNYNISFSCKEANGVKTITLSRFGEQLNIGVATDGSATIDFVGNGKSASIEFYSKAQVDEKITSALGDINAALAQI